MGKIINCSIIICDDYNNVMIAERGKGKNNSPKVWGIFGKDVKGKESTEKCIIKAINQDLKCNIFDLDVFKEYTLDEINGDSIFVFTGKIKELAIYSPNINKIKWVSHRDIDMHEFSGLDKQILMDFFNSKKILA